MLRGTGVPIREAKAFVTLTWARDHTIPQRVEVLNCKVDHDEGVLAMRDVTPEDVTGVRV